MGMKDKSNNHSHITITLRKDEMEVYGPTPKEARKEIQSMLKDYANNQIAIKAKWGHNIEKTIEIAHLRWVDDGK